MSRAENNRRYYQNHKKEQAQLNKEWRAKHPEKSKEYHLNRREKRNAYSRQWRENNPGKVNFYAKQDRIRRKIEIISHYSNEEMACAHCGIIEINCLSIDHINGGGNKHKKELRAKGTSLYNWLKKNNFPSGFQVLCMNCQFIKKAKDRQERGCRN